ncbi:phage tail tape measure protein [Arachidicoccus soli]|uniref:Phage tail tape measure protein n=1 Tax=Arachidicoccus soli TaxID=2341117 RepID=A0A386HRY7_9BACT|nr:phage tail tape measure protein [Arachidicoccus soli]AYD48201.1 phage tail tape measure protein [Arachidicoccus soli]
MDSNTIEFFVKMKDMMSGGLANLAKNSQSSFGKVAQNMKQATQSSNYLNRSVDELKNRLNEVNKVRFGTVLKSEFKTATTEAKSLERQIGRMTRSRGGIFGGGLRSAASAILPGLGIAAMVAGSASFAKASVNSAMQYELKGKMFQALTGSRTGGESLNNYLFKLSQQPGFGKDVYQNAQTMLGFGMNGQQTEKSVKQIGAITMGNTLRAKDMTLALSETISRGHLTAQRLRQFVSAGFNPLQTISEHFKEFGFKTKQTIEELDKDLRKGKITASMVTKAIDIATSAGGKFGGTLNAMADSTAGKMQALQGKWEAFKVGVGQALTPLASGLMQTASSILDSIAPMQKMSDKLLSQKFEVNALVNQITSLNLKNSERVTLIQKLNSSYPDFFKNLDAENTSNETLLQTLQKVNQQYRDNIKLAYNNEIISGNKSAQGQNDIQISYARMAIEAAKMHNEDMFEKYSSIYYSSVMHKSESERIAFFNKKIQGWEQKNQGYQNNIDRTQFVNNYDSAVSGFDNLSNIFNNPKLLASSVSKKNRKAATSLYMQIAKLMGNTDPTMKALMLNDYNRIQAFLPSNGTGATPPGTDAPVEGTGGKTASGITGGGPRVININGVKFADKIEIVHSDYAVGEAELEARLHDMYLRILNSGASVQG